MGLPRLFTTFSDDTPDVKRFAQVRSLKSLTFEGKCSCRRAKPAHFGGHLPATSRLREGGKSAFRLHASFLPCALDALHKQPEKTLLYLFVRKLPTGLMLSCQLILWWLSIMLTLLEGKKSSTRSFSRSNTNSLYCFYSYPGGNQAEKPKQVPPIKNCFLPLSFLSASSQDQLR